MTPHRKTFRFKRRETEGYGRQWVRQVVQALDHRGVNRDAPTIVKGPPCYIHERNVIALPGTPMAHLDERTRRIFFAFLIHEIGEATLLPWIKDAEITSRIEKSGGNEGTFKDLVNCLGDRWIDEVQGNLNPGYRRVLRDVLDELIVTPLRQHYDAEKVEQSTLREFAGLMKVTGTYYRDWAETLDAFPEARPVYEAVKDIVEPPRFPPGEDEARAEIKRRALAFWDRFDFEAHPETGVRAPSEGECEDEGEEGEGGASGPGEDGGEGSEAGSGEEHGEEDDGNAGKTDERETEAGGEPEAGNPEGENAGEGSDTAGSAEPEAGLTDPGRESAPQKELADLLKEVMDEAGRLGLTERYEITTAHAPAIRYTEGMRRRVDTEYGGRELSHALAQTLRNLAVEPGVARVRHQRRGGLDTRRVASAVSGSRYVFRRPRRTEGVEPPAVFILIDVSGSVLAFRGAMARATELWAEALREAACPSAIAVYNTAYGIVKGWSDPLGVGAATATVRDSITGGTYLGSAYRRAVRDCMERPYGDKCLLVVLTDGISSDLNGVTATVEYAESNGIHTLPVVIRHPGSDDAKWNGTISTIHHAFPGVFTVEDCEDIGPEVAREMAREVEAMIPTHTVHR